MMLFDGAFAVPSWVAALPRDVQVAALIGHCQLEEGVPRAVPNAGAAALAGWIVADVGRAERSAARPGGILFMGSSVTRLLAGTALPSPEEGALIEEETAGAVKWDDWNRPAAEGAAEQMDRLAIDEATCAPAPDPVPAPCVLGETPSGPLFEAERDGRVIVVRGLGVTLRTSEAAAKRLRDTLNRALEPPLRRSPPVVSAHL